MFETLTWRVMVFVEAAGTIGRAERLGAFKGLEPQALAVIRNIVPPSRGGECSNPKAEQIWGGLMMDVMLEQEGREAVSAARAFFDQRERELANDATKDASEARDRQVAQERTANLKGEMESEVNSE